MQMDEIRISHDGTWYFNGNKMFRMEIVKFLSSYLEFKNGNYYICWRGQECPVVVEDVPFVITGISKEEGTLKARLADERIVDLPETEVKWNNEIPYISLFIDESVDTKLSRAAFWQITPYLIEKDGKHYIRYS